MSHGKRQVDRLIDASGAKSVKQLADIIGERPNTISTWKERGIPAKKILSASQIVKCRAEWIATGEGEARNLPVREHSYTNEGSLTEDEHQLLDFYRKAEPSIKRAAVTMLENSAKESRKKNGGSTDDG
jgi:phage terminase Nu1 subunit (DNA packaging protein)